MRNLTCILLLAAALLMSCKPSTPDGILSEGKMTDILCDYHIAQSMAEVTGAKPNEVYSYQAAVLKKHDVTQQEFDASLAYYMRHTEELQKIYEDVSDRLKSTAEKVGESEAELRSFGSISATGDTANVWVGESTVMLTPVPMFNQMSFKFVADTAYHAGDRLTLSFNTNFIYQDGVRTGCAMLAVTFKNDSIAYMSNTLSNTGRSTITIKDNQHLGIKTVSGYFILSKSQVGSVSESTLQLMFIGDIKLIRMHETKEEMEMRRKNDSIMAHPSGKLPANTTVDRPLPPSTMPNLNRQVR